MRDDECVMRVAVEACGQRVMSASLDEDGRPLRCAVKWVNLITLPVQLYWAERSCSPVSGFTIEREYGGQD